MTKIPSLIFCCILTTASLNSNAQSQPYHLFCYFVGNGEDGLHLAWSADGFTWKAFNDGKSILTPTAGKDKLMRDPSILQGKDGTYHMVWTVSWGEKGIGYSSSRDLITWTEQRYVPVMEHEPSARNCWAPELFYDEALAQYLIVWSTTIPGRFPEGEEQKYNHRLYYVATKDFVTFNPAKLLYDKKFSVIDAAIVKDGGQYVMFLKDETDKPNKPEKNIRIATSAKAEGPYSDAGNPITGDYWAEGPAPVRVNGRWFVYFDKYTQHKYGVVVSADLTTWVDESDKLSMPAGVRHGTVFSVNEPAMEKLWQRFGGR